MSTYTNMKYYGYIKGEWIELVNFSPEAIKHQSFYVYYHRQESDGRISLCKHSLDTTRDILSYDEMVKHHPEYLI